MNWKAEWLTAQKIDSDIVPIFRKTFVVDKQITKATLYITALGVYEAFINGSRVGNFIMAPGWTSYKHRIQYQTYDITPLLERKNELRVHVARGWFSSPLGLDKEQMKACRNNPKALLAQLHIVYSDGTESIICTDESWQYGESAIRFSEIYDGETYDASFETKKWYSAEKLEYTYDLLIPQEGVKVCEQERIPAQKIIITKKSEVVVDFGQEVTGYVEFSVQAKQGDHIRILHSEVLDKDGNFYNENYRSAKAEINYICKAGDNLYHPHTTFFGFRQIKLDQWPGDPKGVKPEQFTAIAVYSDIRRTGHLKSSNEKLNRFFDNVFWGQRGNFLDVPTDCPQRDECLGWTGDAQGFCRAATYNFDVQQFFAKWLKDLKLDQQDAHGSVPKVIPNVLGDDSTSAGWGDAATVVPWQLYQTYGDKSILTDQYDSMKMWVDYISRVTTTPYLWTGGQHFGDWLSLEVPVDRTPEERCFGYSREDFIASAFYAHSTKLVVEAGKVLKEDVSEYEKLLKNITTTFRSKYSEYHTQTECILALRFGLTEKPKETAERLAKMLENKGHMETGFIGTPHILHALSDNGYSELAYALLLKEDYPSWLYPVTKGATTIWEHWDGITESGELWSPKMNSFNHYSYGAAIDWVYEKAAGIRPLEPGFAKVQIAPIPTDKLDWLEVSLDTAHGNVCSKWSHEGGKIRYDITLPVEGDVIIKGVPYNLQAGNYTMWSE